MYFTRNQAQIYAEQVPLVRIAAEVGTPCYIYSRAAIEANWRAYDEAFAGYPHDICYAVKANSNLAVIDVLARLGSGFDIVSVGELERVLAAGGDPARVVFSGVAKTVGEMTRALECGIRCFDVESEAELLRLDEVASGLGRRAPVAIRVNPDVDPNTHPYIATGLNEAKFGIAIDQAPAVYRRAAALPNIEITGVASHIGSQITDTAPFVDSLARLLDLIDVLAGDGIAIDHIDVGGGLGVRYRDETPPTRAELVSALIDAVGRRRRDLPVTLEPGRSIVAEAGVLLTRVEYLKSSPAKHFAIVDAGMNDLMRPALYQAWHEIEPVVAAEREVRRYDVVGPVCETGDVLGSARELGIAAGDLLIVRDAGAYGATMGSNYNSRPRPAEVMVDGDGYRVVRRRERIEDLWREESRLI